MWNSWLLVDVVFKMPHIATSPFLVKSTSPSNANVAAHLIHNLKMSIVKIYVIFHCDLCIIAAVLLSILSVVLITCLDSLCKIHNLF